MDYFVVFDDTFTGQNRLYDIRACSRIYGESRNGVERSRETRSRVLTKLSGRRKNALRFAAKRRVVEWILQSKLTLRARRIVRRHADGCRTQRSERERPRSSFALVFPTNRKKRPDRVSSVLRTKLLSRRVRGTCRGTRDD